MIDLLNQPPARKRRKVERRKPEHYALWRRVAELSRSGMNLRQIVEETGANYYTLSNLLRGGVEAFSAHVNWTKKDITRHKVNSDMDQRKAGRARAKDGLGIRFGKEAETGLKPWEIQND